MVWWCVLPCAFASGKAMLFDGLGPVTPQLSVELRTFADHLVFQGEDGTPCVRGHFRRRRGVAFPGLSLLSQSLFAHIPSHQV